MSRADRAGGIYYILSCPSQIQTLKLHFTSSPTASGAQITNQHCLSPNALNLRSLAQKNESSAASGAGIAVYSNSCHRRYRAD